MPRCSFATRASTSGFRSRRAPPLRIPAREAATNITLVSLKAVADGLRPPWEATSPGAKISKQGQRQGRGQSDVASIKATDPDPRFAATLANAFAESYIVFRRGR